MADGKEPNSGSIVRKRLILCLDGTWNTADGQDITNIVRIRDLIEPKYTDEHGNECHQRVYYEAGVGTGFGLDRYIGGGTGAGLGKNVRAAYRFLSQAHEPGQDIYIFGFSRGAFTARSLAGYIGSAGLLRPSECTAENEQRAWNFYRTSPKNRFPHDRLELSDLSYPDVRIKVLGVFDTVGSLGIPTELLESWNQLWFSFHDVTLGSNVDHALHALAIDEMRGPFGASVWQYPHHKDNVSVEQVWFSGAHSNVGGGYPDSGLSDLALEWMLSRIEAKGLGLRLVPGWRSSISADPYAALIDSRTALYRWSRMRPRIRVINQSIPRDKSDYRLSSLAPHALTIGEMVHWSALARWTASVNGTVSVSGYRPVNLDAALKAMFEATPPRPIPVVGRSGEPLDWFRNPEHRAEFEELLPPQYRGSYKTTLGNLELSGLDTSGYTQPFEAIRAPVVRASDQKVQHP